MISGNKFEFDDPLGVTDSDDEKLPKYVPAGPDQLSIINEMKQEEDFKKHCTQLQNARNYMLTKGVAQPVILNQLWKKLHFK